MGLGDRVIRNPVDGKFDIVLSDGTVLDERCDNIDDAEAHLKNYREAQAAFNFMVPNDVRDEVDGEDEAEPTAEELRAASKPAKNRGGKPYTP